MLHTTTTSPTYLDEVQDPEHIKFIMDNAKTKTPEAMRKNCKLLDPSTANPIYSPEAIAKVLAPQSHSVDAVPRPSPPPGTLTPKSGAAFVTARRPGKSAPPRSEKLAPPPSEAPEPFHVDCPALAAASGSTDTSIWLPEYSWPAVMTAMQEVSAVLDDKVLLFYRKPQGASFSVLLNETAFQQTSRQGTYEFRCAPPTPTKERQSLQSPERERLISQRLSFDSFQTVTSTASVKQAQLKYEREVRKTLSSELEKRFPTDIPSTSLETMLDSIDSIQKVWTTFLRDEDQATDSDGIDPQRKLLWFLEL